MAEFRSDTEKKKWQSLQNQAGHSLQRIVQGTATQADFQRVSNALNGLNTLAKRVFDEAVSAAEVQAKKFQSQHEKALDGLARVGDLDLSPFEQALNAALKQQNPDLVDAIHDAITLEIFEQTEELKSDMAEQVQKLKDLLPPKDLPTVDDVLAAQDLLTEKMAQVDEARWDHRRDDLLDRIGSLFRNTLVDLAEAVQRSRSHSNPRIGYQAPRLEAPTRPAFDIEDVVPRSPFEQAHALLAEPVTAETATTEVSAEQTTSGGSTLSTGSEGVVQMTDRTEAAITKAAEDQTSLYQQLMSFLKNPSAPGSPFNPSDSGHGGAGQDVEQSEQEKADTWWRSFRNWMGDKYDKAKDWNKENKGWLGGLGMLLASMLLDPQLYENIGSMIGKYLTWDNVKKVASASWHMMLDKGKDLVEWVQDKLGLNKPLTQKEVDAAKTDGGVKLSKTAAERLKDPKVQAQIAQFSGSFKDQHPGAMVPKATGDTHSSFWSKVSHLFGVQNGPTNVAVDQSVIDANTAIANGGSPTFNNRSTIVPKSDLGTPASAVVPAAKPTSIIPGVTTQAPGTASGPEAGPAMSDLRPSKGTAQIGLSSFKFHSSIDDSLLMMNTPYFSS
jgi:hypothetical protein